MVHWVTMASLSALTLKNQRPRRSIQWHSAFNWRKMQLSKLKFELMTSKREIGAEYDALPSGWKWVLWLRNEVVERGQLSATAGSLSAIKDYFFFFYVSISFFPLFFFFSFIGWNKMAAVSGINGQLDESVANLLVTRRIGHEVATN